MQLAAALRRLAGLRHATAAGVVGPAMVGAHDAGVVRVAVLEFDAAMRAAVGDETGTALTDAQRAALATQEATLRAQLNAASIQADAS